MKALQVGLGSMGKRRIRNLLALGITDITGFDKREDTREEAKDKYNIKTTAEISAELLTESDIYISFQHRLTGTMNI